MRSLYVDTDFKVLAEMMALRMDELSREKFRKMTIGTRREAKNQE